MSKRTVGSPVDNNNSTPESNGAADFFTGLFGTLLVAGAVVEATRTRTTYVREVYIAPPPPPRPTYRIVERIVEVVPEPTLAGSMHAGRELVHRVTNSTSWDMVANVQAGVRYGAALSCDQVATMVRQAPSFKQVDIAQAALPAVYDRYNWAKVCDSACSFNVNAIRSML